jgi:predicted lipid-binding transport protein (Tim44 family)
VTFRLPALAAIVGVLSLIAVDAAEARRGGSFGSRGARTYSAPPPTRTAPTQAQPVQRSMTPQTPANAARAPARAAAPRAQPRSGIFSNPLVSGLLLGGLIGALLGFGFGGFGGGLAAMLQIAVIALVAFMLFRLFARRRQTANAAVGGSHGPAYDVQHPANPAPEPLRYAPGQPLGGGAYAATEPSDEIGVTQDDLDAFERLLREVQTAFGAEDYSALRSRTTPEVMSFLSEELSQNATSGRRNQVTDVKLLQGDTAEAWREDDQEYVTVAMRYESIDVMVDRSSGAVLSGDPTHPTEATELWTFVRQRGMPWKLSAIQEA